ncbi:MAG: hypothetical protein QXV17_07555 [Candidatus Micrarchaeaceae archaeon]
MPAMSFMDNFENILKKIQPYSVNPVINAELQNPEATKQIVEKTTDNTIKPLFGLPSFDDFLAIIIGIILIILGIIMIGSNNKIIEAVAK